MIDTCLRLGAAACLAAAPAAQERFFAPEGLAPASRFGSVVACAGDVDADGFPDFAVGAPEDDQAGEDAGLVRVFSGFDGTELLARSGAEAGEHFGAALAAAGDANADGHADLCVGAPEAHSGLRHGAGRAAVLSGRDGAELARLLGTESHDNLGRALAALGDRRGNGVFELALGVPGHDGAANGAGLVLIADAASLRVLRELPGRAALDAFGSTLAASGDFDHDGVPDLAVGAPYADPNGESSGRVWVISGATGLDLFTSSGEAVGEKHGLGLAGAGDLDRDGFADLAVGAPFAKNGGTARYGRVEVHAGRGGRLIRTWHGDAIDDRFGWSVSAAGDVDGDGVGDVAVGAPWADAGGGRSGSVAVRSGTDGATLARLPGRRGRDELGASLALAGDLDGDGHPELVAGAPAAAGERGFALVASLRTGTPGAAQPLGQGCGAGAPVLSAQGSVTLGAALPLVVHGASPGATACFAASASAPPAPYELGAGCRVLIDLAGVQVLGTAPAGADGAATLSVPLPSAPALAGASLRAQVLVHPTAGTLGFDLTNGLELTLGH